MIHDGHLVIY